MSDSRPGEIALPHDPGARADDAGLVFIGRVASPHRERAACPKNMAAARETPQQAIVEIDEAYRAGLDGLDAFTHAIVLTWLDRSRRDLIVQKPRHADMPRGVFALRSPVRPNPIGLHVVELVGVDGAAGRVYVSAIDVLDGTPVIDVKPYYASADAMPQARRTGS